MTIGEPMRVHRFITYPVVVPGSSDRPSVVNVEAEEELVVEPSLDWTLAVEISPTRERVTFSGCRGAIDDAVMPQLLIHLLTAARRMIAGEIVTADRMEDR